MAAAQLAHIIGVVQNLQRSIEELNDQTHLQQQVITRLNEIRTDRDHQFARINQFREDNNMAGDNGNSDAIYINDNEMGAVRRPIGGRRN